MISSVHAHNLKGATFTAPLGARTIVVGPNGAGKSSRSQALQLAVLGYVPGIGKRNQDIMDALHDGQGRDLRVGVTLDGRKLERRFARSKAGAVSQDLLVNGVKAKPAEFAQEFAGVGVIDISAFLALSDQKKIDEVFRLFPPAGDVKSIGEQIATLAGRLNEAERKEREALSMISAIQAQKARAELPAGTMADKAAEVARAEQDLKQAREELHAANLEAARAEERERAMDQERTPPPVQPANPTTGFSGTPRTPDAPATRQPVAHVDVAAVLERVLVAMDRSGCEVCAARMVIKSELAKARQANPREEAA